ncbi:MAG: Crp/Fnr family transcriptional regulator [Acidobacteriia bacterium]|nr:Crp/Fnr family transcriptional regulator [Terriglobia bacterium]
MAAELRAISHTIPYPARTVVFVEGQAPPGVFILRRGQVKLSLRDFDGETLILKVAHPGEVLALSDAVSGKNCQLRAETLGPCEIDFVEREHFLHFVQAHEEICLLVAMELSNTFMSTNHWMGSLVLARWVAPKVAYLLLDWARASGETRQPVHLELLLTYEEIGQMVGAARETVSRVLSDFQKKRLIRLHGSSLLILDRASLAAIVKAGRKKSPGGRSRALRQPACCPSNPAAPPARVPAAGA